VYSLPEGALNVEGIQIDPSLSKRPAK